MPIYQIKTKSGLRGAYIFQNLRLQRIRVYRKISKSQRTGIWFTNVQEPFQACSAHLLYILQFEPAAYTYTYPKHFHHVVKFSAPIYVQNFLRLHMYKILYACIKHLYLRLYMYNTFYAGILTLRLASKYIPTSLPICTKLSAPMAPQLTYTYKTLYPLSICI